VRLVRPLLLAALVFVCFAPVLRAGFLNWDDTRLLVDNLAFRGFGAEHVRWMLSTFHMGHYHPLTWLSFALDWSLWGMDPRGYHLVNVALHAANAVTAYALALVVFRLAEVDASVRAPAALVAGALFALHPLRVESVAWVTERRDVLSTLP
jgi:hypothetical protein